jgi:hypothetical protein
MIQGLLIVLLLPLGVLFEIIFDMGDFGPIDKIQRSFVSDKILQASAMFRMIFQADITESHLKACARGGFTLRIDCGYIGDLIPTEDYTDFVFSVSEVSYRKINFPNRIRVQFFQQRKQQFFQRSIS